MNFARWTFRLAGIYGLLVTLPLYFGEERMGRDFPPAITHPELYYGFIGVVVAWQVAFLVIAHEPMRFRPLMLVAVLEKFSYGIAAIILFQLHRAPGLVRAFGLVDLLLGLLFSSRSTGHGCEDSPEFKPPSVSVTISQLVRQRRQ